MVSATLKEKLYIHVPPWKQIDDASRLWLARDQTKVSKNSVNINNKIWK